MKKRDFLKEVKGLKADELLNKSKGIAEELLRLRFRKSAGQLEHNARIKELRQQLAQVETCRSQLKLQAVV